MHIVRYFLIGGMGACVDLTLYVILVYSIDMNYLLAGAVSFVFSTLVNYYLGIRFLFDVNVRFSSTHEVLLVFVASGLGLGFHQLILYATAGYLELNLVLSKVITMGIVFFWNYSARTYYIYAESRHS